MAALVVKRSRKRVILRWACQAHGGYSGESDLRNIQPRIGRTLIARGRDVAIRTAFGTNTLESFRI